MNVNDEIAASMMAFRNKGEDQIPGSTKNVLLEVTDVTKKGRLEIAFNAALPGSPRIYLSMSLPELMAAILRAGISDE